MNRDEPALLSSEGTHTWCPATNGSEESSTGHTIIDSRNFTFVWEIPSGRVVLPEPTSPMSSSNLVKGVLQPTRDGLTGSTRRGELPPTADVDEPTVQLAGPIFTHHIMLRATVSDERITNPTKEARP